MTDKKVSVEEMLAFIDWIEGWASLYGKSTEWEAIRAALKRGEEMEEKMTLLKEIEADIDKKYHGGYGTLPASVGVLLKHICDFGEGI